MSVRTLIYLLVVLTILAVALSTGGAIYYLLFACMAAMALLALETVLATLFFTRVQADMRERRVTRGESVSVRVVLRRQSVLPVGGISLAVASPADEGASVRLDVDLPPFRAKEYRYSLNCPHRGRYEVGVSRLTVADVFGLFRFSRSLNARLLRLDVLPRVIPVPPMRLDPSDVGPQARVLKVEDAASPSDVMLWQQGDELKRVHWKLTMRRRELMVKVFEESARPDTLVLMDLSPVGGPGGQRLLVEDALCEAAASAVQAQLAAGWPVRMPLASPSPTELSAQAPAEFGQFLDMLTGLSFDGEYSFEQVLALEMRRMQRTGGVILLTAKLNASIVDIAVRMRMLDMRVRVVWVTDCSRREATEMMSLLDASDVDVQRVDPWANMAL